LSTLEPFSQEPENENHKAVSQTDIVQYDVMQ